jgi:hypothetical protein
MKEKKPNIEQLLSGTRYSFREGFPERVMKRILETKDDFPAVDFLSDRISRLFYLVNVPGLAAAMAILILLLLAGDYGDVSYRVQYTTTFNEILNDFYNQLMN